MQGPTLAKIETERKMLDVLNGDGTALERLAECAVILLREAIEADLRTHAAEDKS